MSGLILALAALQAALLIVPIFGLVVAASGRAPPGSGPAEFFFAGALLFAAPMALVVVLSRKTARNAKASGGLIQGALLVAMFATLAGYIAYARAPSPGAGYGMRGELNSGGPVFGLSVGMSHQEAAKVLTASGRFNRVNSECLSPGTFEIAYPSGMPPDPSERDCKGSGIEELWDAGPLWFAETQMLELDIRHGVVVRIRWFGSGRQLG